MKVGVVGSRQCLFAFSWALGVNGFPTGAFGQVDGKTPPEQPLRLSPAMDAQPTSKAQGEGRPGGNETAVESKPGFWIFNRPQYGGAMSSDRPGFSDSFSVVPCGYSHLEFGYTYAFDEEESDETTNQTLGEFSLRTGLTNNFELRIKWTGFSLRESHSDGISRWAGRHITITDHDDGGTDMGIGFKSQLLQQRGLIPNLSIIPAISLPTGTAGKSTGDVDPEVRLAWNYALSDKWTVYGVGLATWISDDDGRFFQAGASLATSYSFTKQIGGFVEYYGLYPSTRDSDCQHNIDFGPVVLVNPDFQIDIRVGFGLNEEAPGFQVGIGACYRF